MDSHSIAAGLDVSSAMVDIEGLRDGLSLGEGDQSIGQLAGEYKKIIRSGYEAHHIPSKAALKQFGVNTSSWPAISLEKDDHAKTDSYRGKQEKKFESIFPDVKGGERYK